ncbi:hypothetical protein A8135_07560 [Legionella jamestowniensis]|uniref:Uncharacterized protein n=1 Tax=Legionella jamestowniensis TaxID=455 RepID=A0ABX2Y2P0_9GAMM|nr:hypothetical protein A8135_07560 [Legionella jamestowniensis]
MAYARMTKWIENFLRVILKATVVSARHSESDIGLKNLLNGALGTTLEALAMMLFKLWPLRE